MEKATFFGFSPKTNFNKYSFKLSLRIPHTCFLAEGQLNSTRVEQGLGHGCIIYTWELSGWFSMQKAHRNIHFFL